MPKERTAPVSTCSSRLQVVMRDVPQLRFGKNLGTAYWFLIDHRRRKNSMVFPD